MKKLRNSTFNLNCSYLDLVKLNLKNSTFYLNCSYLGLVKRLKGGWLVRSRDFKGKVRR